MRNHTYGRRRTRNTFRDLVLFLALTILISGSAFAATYSQGPTDDALVSSQKPSNKYGTVTYLHVYSPTDYQNAYLKFDLSGIPDTATVTKAELFLYAFSITTSPISNVYHMPDGWDELSLDWYTHKTLTVGDMLEGPSVPALNQWSKFDLLGGTGTAWNYANDLTDDRLSVMLQSASTSPNNYVRYYSKEHTGAGLRPYLHLEYTTAAVPEPGSLLLLGFGLIGLAGARRRVRRQFKK